MMTSLSLTRGLGEDQEEEEEEEEEGKKGLEEEECVEREHMFDKVVTPSDVGKLNRLVIPKQHAERYFPLDSSTNENKGLLLNFEDLTGKSWRFRYSYWNSSQSYVMTKGWSRFVKDKKLDAGDIVSFQRCVGKKESTRRLFIDWRKRLKVVPDHHQFGHAGSMFPPARFYSFPTTTTTSYGLYNHPQMLPRHHGGYGNYNHQIQRELGYGYFVRSVDQRLNLTAEVADPLVIESVPVMMMHGGAPAHHHHHHHHHQEEEEEEEVNVVVGKRLRLFGVNMECGGESRVTEDESSSSGGSLPRGGGGGYSSSSLLQLRLGSSMISPNEDHHHFSKKGKSSLLSSDFDHQ